jgi:hypothetical protein
VPQTSVLIKAGGVSGLKNFARRGPWGAAYVAETNGGIFLLEKAHWRTTSGSRQFIAILFYTKLTGIIINVQSFFQ